jgi:hypothetical protein
LSYALALILFLWNTPTAVVHFTETGVPQPQTEHTLCVIGTTGLPMTVRFRDSITLTRAIQQSGIARDSMKNEVWIVRRLENDLIQPVKIDLRTIEKGKTDDYRLDQHDMVIVRQKKKQVAAMMEAIWAECRVCGCRPMAGIEGPMIVPKKWVEPANPQAPDPNH